MLSQDGDLKNVQISVFLQIPGALFGQGSQAGDVLFKFTMFCLNLQEIFCSPNF